MKIKSVSAHIFIGISVLLFISSFSPLAEGDEGSPLFRSRKESSPASGLKLLNVDVPQTGNLAPGVAYWTTIRFEASLKPEIRRACFSFSGDGQSCVDVQAKDVVYGSNPYFRVPIQVPAGTKRIDCYAEYMQDGETRRTNTVTYRVIAMKPKE